MLLWREESCKQKVNRLNCEHTHTLIVLYLLPSLSVILFPFSRPHPSIFSLPSLDRSQYVHLFNTFIISCVCVCVCRSLRYLLMESKLRMMLTGVKNELKTWSSSSRIHYWELKVAETNTSAPRWTTSASM